MTEESNYRHRPIDGLPASLLVRNGGQTSPVVPLMQKAGLNRERRRTLPAPRGRFLAMVQVLDVPKADWSALSILSNPADRFAAFWAVQRLRAKRMPYQGTKSYAIALDQQLLDAWDPGWVELQLDEQQLLPSCPEWPRLRNRIEQSRYFEADPAALGVFMLWPRLVAALAGWDELAQERRLALGHAVFALSSISMSDWFVREALRHQAALQGELAPLLWSPDSEDTEQEGEEDAAPQDDARSAQEGAAVPSPEADAWPQLLARLDSLVSQLRSQPTREDVDDLVQLAREFEASAVELPVRGRAVADEVRGRIDTLMGRLRQLAGDEGFDWLDESLLEQVHARWQLALDARSEVPDLKILGDDAGAALDRVEAGAVTLRATVWDIAAHEAELAAVEHRLVQANRFAERTVITRQRLELQQTGLALAQALEQAKFGLMDAASPFGETFDADNDYAAMLAPAQAERVDDAPQDAKPSAEPDAPAAEIEDSVEALEGVPQQQLEVSAAPPANEPVAVPAAVQAAVPNEVDARAAPAPARDHGPAHDAHAPAQGDAEHGAVAATPARQAFSDAAGLACAPVWSALAAGQPGAAFHCATWIVQTMPGIKPPPPALLACTALAQAVLLPEGSLQAALADNYLQLLPADYQEQEPRGWHAALNLLLAAATMRPMVLAPNSGAGTVSAYMHQDGQFPRLYGLVQHLRELSPKLMGFRIDPGALRRARGEAALRADVQAVQKQADDWLRIQGPSYTNKFAAATDVWRQWLKPGADLHTLVSAVAHNRSSDARLVRELLVAFSDHEHVRKLIHKTDRVVLGRRRGDDIHAGALDQLLRNTEEALQFPRQWLALQDLIGGEGDRLRDLLEQVRALLLQHQPVVEEELTRTIDDPWGLVRAGQVQALAAFRAFVALFDGQPDLPAQEPSVQEVLGRPLLLVPSLRLRDDWSVDSEPAQALQLVAHADWQVLPGHVFEHRVERGDLAGAEMMVQAGWVERPAGALRPERDRWRQELRRGLQEGRRTVEIGSAYGYLAEAERHSMESELALLESQVDEMRRFDIALEVVHRIRDAVARAKGSQAQEVRAQLEAIASRAELAATRAQVERALSDGDIATAREIVYWLSQGKAVPTDDASEADVFGAYFPQAVAQIGDWLGERKRDQTGRDLRGAQALPPCVHLASASQPQRDAAARVFEDWADMKAQHASNEKRLTGLLAAVGFSIQALRPLQRDEWQLDVEPVVDRHICPVPAFGSLAGGRYRVVCAWKTLSPDEVLQAVGTAQTQQRPTILLIFGRMTERSWGELSRLARVKRRTFLALDETLLLFLIGQQGSKLRAWMHAALPFTHLEPYDATAGVVPPEMFYGRGTELDAVCGLNGRCFIYGGRQLGKTALLKRAEQTFHAPERGQFARWIDLRAEGIGVSRSAAEVWTALHDKLRDVQVLGLKSSAPTPGKKQGVEALVRAIREFLDADGDRRILLLLDEADRFFELDGRNDFEETRKLKQLMDETARRFKVVFAGLHNVLRMTERPNHPLAHFGAPIEIGPLREGDEAREAVDLICGPMRAAGFEFESRQLMLRILAQTNYYPSLIQLYCSQLLRHLVGQVAGKHKTQGPRFVVTDRDIEQVYSSESLRDEIRAKFRLTLQLDPRYEVVAYAMALDLLRGRYSYTDGMPWQEIRQAAVYWWPQGFHDTSELDFRVLLDEMLGLGVLRRLEGGSYALRNPNVLLLLGTRDEIESVLVKDREPAAEFESATFRPPLQTDSSATRANVFTYQQLSHLMQRRNGVHVIAGTAAAGIEVVAQSLRDYLKADSALRVTEHCTDRQAFDVALQRMLADREQDRVTICLVPDTAPWTQRWVTAAEDRVRRLSSDSRFASVVFVAGPSTLWGLLQDPVFKDASQTPWMSLFPWSEGFLRSWLEERQLALEIEDRRSLVEASGLWPMLVGALAGDCAEVRVLRERLATVRERLFDGPALAQWRHGLGLDVAEPAAVLEVMARYGDSVQCADLASLAEVTEQRAGIVLRWAELLGLCKAEEAGYWALDPIAATLLRVG